MDSGERLMTVAEVADEWRLSKMTVYRLVRSGELPAVQFGRSYRIEETAVREARARLAKKEIAEEETE
jgi:excisionase family DNA binding protein